MAMNQAKARNLVEGSAVKEVTIVLVEEPSENNSAPG